MSAGAGVGFAAVLGLLRMLNKWDLKASSNTICQLSIAIVIVLQ